MSRDEKNCRDCKHCGMDMDLDPYCAHPKVLKRVPYGQVLYLPVPECPLGKGHPLFEARKR